MSSSDEHGAARAVGNRDQRVFSGGIAATLIIHRANDDRIEQRPGSDGRPARVIEFRDARGLAAIGHQHDRASPPSRAPPQSVGAQHERVVNRSARTRRICRTAVLQLRHVVGKIRKAASRFRRIRKRPACLPGRTTWRMKCAAASVSNFRSLNALMLESTISARSSGRLVCASKRSIFCGTPSSES